MSRQAQSLYDRQITIFSPEGKLFQVEYAFRAVRGANMTALGIKGKDCVVLVSQKKVASQTSAQEDKLLDQSAVTSFYHITPTIGGAFLGMPADCRSVVFRAREKASEFQYENGHMIPVSYLAQRIANLNQVYTQHAYMRLQACIGMLIGIDDETGPTLMRFDPSGWYTGNLAAAVGTKETEATSALERLIKNKVPENVEETVESAISTLQTVIGVDFKPNDIEVSVVSVAHPQMRRLNGEEIDRYLSLIAERD